MIQVWAGAVNGRRQWLTTLILWRTGGTARMRAAAGLEFGGAVECYRDFGTTEAGDGFDALTAKEVYAKLTS